MNLIGADRFKSKNNDQNRSYSIVVVRNENRKYKRIGYHSSRSGELNKFNTKEHLKVNYLQNSNCKTINIWLNRFSLFIFDRWQ